MTKVVTPKKRFGQNFLVDKKVVEDLVAATELVKSDVVVEIGAGTGVLTKELAKQAGKVLTFELDQDLIPTLEKNLQEFDNVEIFNQDFLKVNNQQFSTQPFKLIGSIPYQITSPLLHKLLTLKPSPSPVVLLIQKEVAEKIAAEPPKATYLSNVVKLLGEVKVVRFVSKTAFWPVPEVDGAIVKINCSCASLMRLPGGSIRDFQEFLHRGFQHPRKMLRNKFDPNLLKSAGIDPTHRAQELALANWWRLFSTF